MPTKVIQASSPPSPTRTNDPVLSKKVPEPSEPMRDELQGAVEWPETVTCEMNIDEWERALKSNGLLKQFSDVIDGFKNGFHQGIPTHDLGNNWFFYSPPNHQGALLLREKIEETIRKEIEAKRMFGPYSEEQVHNRFGFFRTNPLGAAINGDGLVRPINDLSYPRNDSIPSVNSFVNKHDYDTTWDDFKTVSKFFRNQTQPLLLAIFDWEKAYRCKTQKVLVKALLLNGEGDGWSCKLCPSIYQKQDPPSSTWQVNVRDEDV
ncbi:hypothetical protein PSHT_12898 [Puccinia striiformis]|uniref:Uncharacterized protein n=1 Tax=Puccinia striiformis TaxID=27350 RepID=A0A2S4UTU0_9BASI|nr:hypothetical protein PSHT_12898 [Puccinia striiformis]